MRKWSKRRNPNATRLMRLARLFAASVGPLLSLVGCQARIWLRHFLIVRPSRRTSMGRSRSAKSRMMSSTHSGGEIVVGLVVDPANGFLGVPCFFDVAFRVASLEEP
jgi:hypothetical protein